MTLCALPAFCTTRLRLPEETMISDFPAASREQWELDAWFALEAGAVVARPPQEELTEGPAPGLSGLYAPLEATD